LRVKDARSALDSSILEVSSNGDNKLSTWYRLEATVGGLESEAVGDELTELLIIGFNVDSKELSVGVLYTLVVGCTGIPDAVTQNHFIVVAVTKLSAMLGDTDSTLVSGASGVLVKRRRARAVHHGSAARESWLCLWRWLEWL